jgi:integrase
MVAGALQETPSFREFAQRIVEERAKSGIRGAASERSRFDLHLSTAQFASKRLDEVSREDLEVWLAEMKAKPVSVGAERTLSMASIQRAYALITAVFSQAGPEGQGLVKTNPCLGLRIGKRKSDRDAGEKRVSLTLAQQRSFGECPDLDEVHRLPILFAIGTGLQQGEQFSLRLADVKLDDPEPHVIVRFAGTDLQLAPGKHIRRVPLLGGGCPALEAAKKWMEILRVSRP